MDKFYIATILWHLIISASTVQEFPVGHGLPFGSHKPPSIKIEEYTINDAPTPLRFYEDHVKFRKPAIFRDAIKKSDAYQLWTDDYIRANFGNCEVRLDGKLESIRVPPVGEKYFGRDTIRHFVDNYHYDDRLRAYVVSDLPGPMHRDMGVIPSLGACGDMKNTIIEADIWWSGGNTRSIIHKDAYNQVNCLLNGTKYWKLIEDKYTKELYKKEEEGDIGGFSQIDPYAVDMLKHPDVQKIEWSNLTINAGDCLYLPASYYHQVISTGTHNLAVTILFSRFDNVTSLDFSDCDSSTDYNAVRSLSDYNVQWISNGTGYMIMGKPDLEMLRKDIIKASKSYEEKSLNMTMAHFSNDFGKDDGQMPVRYLNITKVFRLMDKDADGIASPSEIAMMSHEELRQFLTEMDRENPSNTYEYEYYMIPYVSVRYALECMKSYYEMITQEKWLKTYQIMGGSEDFGNKIFKKLANGRSSVVSRDITKLDMDRALEDWNQYTTSAEREMASYLNVPSIDGKVTSVGQKTTRREDFNDLYVGKREL